MAHTAALSVAAGAWLGLAVALAVASPAGAEDTGSRDAAPRVAAHSGPARSATASATRKPLSSINTAAGASVQPALTITRSGQSPFPLRSGRSAAAELSGISYAGGTTYYAVGDNGQRFIWEVYTSLNTSTGRIRSSLVTAGIDAPGLGGDSEGIAVRPGRGSAWVSDEMTSTITEFDLATGATVGSVAVPAIYRPANVQNNMGLESLAYGGGSLWTANEEALRPDGALSTTEAGSWVRLQRFDGPDLTAGAQFAYRTDPISRMSPFVTVERSGLVDLLVLPDGSLLALERELGGCLPRFRSRVYLVDHEGATDVSSVPGLTDGGFTAVTKTLLWQGVFGLSNFEGMTLGPRLSGGGYSLLLVSDNGNGELAQRQDVFSLILNGITDPSPPTPGEITL